jgi:hypothetical protein
MGTEGLLSSRPTKKGKLLKVLKALAALLLSR